MSDQDFDVYLARASNLSQRYRDEATEKPSQAIDSAILTASRRTPVSIAIAEPQSWFKRWRIPLSFAAVMLLGVGVTLRTVMEETKLSAPPAVAPPPASAPPQPIENKGVAESAADAVMGGAASSSSEPTPPLTPVPAEKNGIEEELADEQPVATMPAAPQDKATEETPMPEPATRAAVQQDALESQSQSGSLGSDLGESKPAARRERDDSVAQSPAEPAKPDGDSSVPQLDQAIPDAAESEARPAPPVVESAPPVVPQAFPSDGPRLPEGHRPIVDGKTYRAEKDKAIREAAEKKTSAGASTIVDNIEDAPEIWLRRVVELRRQGRIEEADAELVRFRARYPDYPVPIEQ